MIKHPLLLAALGCAAVACILQVVGVATPNWTSVKTDIGPVSISANGGLWKYCNTAGDESRCEDIPDVDWIKAVRAFGILAILVMAGATAVGVLVVLLEKLTGQIVVAAALGIVGAICSVISFAIFAAKAESGVSYGYSFALCIVGAVLAGVSGGCFFAGKSKVNVQ